MLLGQHQVLTQIRLQDSCRRQGDLEGIHRLLDVGVDLDLHRLFQADHTLYTPTQSFQRVLDSDGEFDGHRVQNIVGGGRKLERLRVDDLEALFVLLDVAADCVQSFVAFHAVLLSLLNYSLNKATRSRDSFGRLRFSHFDGFSGVVGGFQSQNVLGVDKTCKLGHQVESGRLQSLCGMRVRQLFCVRGQDTEAHFVLHTI